MKRWHLPSLAVRLFLIVLGGVILAIILSNSFLQYTDNDIIGNKSAAVHSSFSLYAVFSTVFSSFTKNISCRNLRDIEGFGNDLSLSTLTGTGST